MLTVAFSQLDATSPHAWSADASDLGLAPGEWPDFIAVMHDKRPDEGVLFQRGPLEGNGYAVAYWTKAANVRLTVFND